MFLLERIRVASTHCVFNSLPCIYELCSIAWMTTMCQYTHIFDIKSILQRRLRWKSLSTLHYFTAFINWSMGWMASITMHWDIVQWEWVELPSTFSLIPTQNRENQITFLLNEAMWVNLILSLHETSQQHFGNSEQFSKRKLNLSNFLNWINWTGTKPVF